MASSVNIHLIGKQGCGKSATGNSILKKKVFLAKTCSEPVTHQIQLESIQVSNRTFKVWDRPGITEDSRQAEDIVRKLWDTINAYKSENHILLWVLRYGELCGPEDEHLLKTLSSIFGQNFLKTNTVVVITHKDNFDLDVEGTSMEFEHWVKQQRGFFKKLASICNSRVLPIDNRSMPEEQTHLLLTLLISLSSTFQEFSVGKTDHLTTKTSTRELPTPNLSKKSAQPPGASKPTKLRGDDRIKLKSQIDRLISTISDNKEKAKLESLKQIKMELETNCYVTEREDLLSAVKRETDREIERCKTAISTDEQTRQYLNHLTHSLLSGPVDLGLS